MKPTVGSTIHDSLLGKTGEHEVTIPEDTGETEAHCRNLPCGGGRVPSVTETGNDITLPTALIRSECTVAPELPTHDT
jgi:hypothetical protein